MNSAVNYGLLGGSVAVALYYSAVFEEHHRRLLHDRSQSGDPGSDTYRERLSALAAWRSAPYVVLFGAYLVARAWE